MGPGIMYGGGEDGDAAGCGKSKNKSNRCGILEAVAVVVFAFDIFTSDSVGKSMYNRSDSEKISAAKRTMIQQEKSYRDTIACALVFQSIRILDAFR